ncbi:MAG TPA: hypothetical protein VHJ20_06470, partial [Polyangia bacterium]|nr:hypothetical protein [Polyangia bacterium]
APSVAPAPPPAPAPVAEPAPAEPAPPPVPVIVSPIPISDSIEWGSDHDAVVGHVGVGLTVVSPAPLTYKLRAFTGCPTEVTTGCDPTLAGITARTWRSRNVALLGGLVIGAGGGRSGSTSLDSYFAIGPIVGGSLLLGLWRHLAVSASPDLAFVWFKPAIGDSSASVKVIQLRGALEGELHFGFVGVPALSLGLTTGLGFKWVSDGQARLWSLQALGAGGVRDVLTNLFVRYYL